MLEAIADSAVSLQRNTPVAAVLEEDTAIDLALVNTGLLVPVVHDVVGTRGLLQYTDLVLSLSGVVVRESVRHYLERLAAYRVVYLERTKGCVSMSVARGFRSSTKVRGNKHLLLFEIQRDGEVLPVGVVNRDRPYLSVLAV